MNWLKGAFTKNLILKFSALVCGVVLWVYVDGFVPVQRAFTVPVILYSSDGRKLVFEGENLDLTDWYSHKWWRVKVTVRGPSRVVRTTRGCTSFVEVDPKENEVHRFMHKKDGSPPSSIYFRLDGSQFPFDSPALSIVDIAPPGVVLRFKGTGEQAQQEKH